MMDPCRSRDDELGATFEAMRPRLQRMVELRLHPRVHRRLDASDVIQEAFLNVQRTYPCYREDPKLPFYLWVRRIVGDKLHELHRRHLGFEMRDVRREDRSAAPEVSTLSLSRALLDDGPTPSEASSRKEEVELLRQALDGMKEEEREALTLRHFEEATNEEVASILGVSAATASRHYLNALKSLRSFLQRSGLRSDV